jgi:hypothetical protein
MRQGTLHAPHWLDAKTAGPAPPRRRAAAMRSTPRSLLLLALIALTACATHRDPIGHACGIDYVDETDHGLKVFFKRGVNVTVHDFGGLTVTRSGKGPPTNYAIEDGRLKAQHNFQIFSSRYLLLNMGDSAGTFNGFGGCTYTAKSDKFGRYLEIADSPGDTELGTSTEEVRPWDFWGSSRAP